LDCSNPISRFILVMIPAFVLVTLILIYTIEAGCCSLSENLLLVENCVTELLKEELIVHDLSHTVS
jgi:hypothetical protein